MYSAHAGGGTHRCGNRESRVALRGESSGANLGHLLEAAAAGPWLSIVGGERREVGVRLRVSAVGAASLSTLRVLALGGGAAELLLLGVVCRVLYVPLKRAGA